VHLVRLHVRRLSALLLTLSVAAPAAAQTSVTGRLSRITIDNFGEVNPHYFRGAQPKGHDYADLAALGIKTVIDLTKDGDQNEKQLVENAGMSFHRIPLTTTSRPDAAAVEEFLKLVNDHVNQPVYVHCQGGRHRTGTMTAIFRMTQDGWSADRAFDEMKKYQFEKGFVSHNTLKGFVYDYYSGLQQAEQRHVAAAGGGWE
jgi:protein tyrosine/serine phosphatase